MIYFCDAFRHQLINMHHLIILILIATLAFLLSSISAIAQFGLSALPLAIIIGMFFGHFYNGKLDLTAKEVAINKFCQQQLLRVGIILFGFSLSFQQIVAVGWQAFILDILIISIVFTTGLYLGIKIFKLDRDVAILTSVGSAICGAAAVLATSPVLKAKQQDIAVAVATVVVFGTIAMFSYPLIYQISGMTEPAFGIYIGSTVHEVAQAVAAAESIGGNALQNAVVVKLIRVMLLVPFIILLSAILNRQSSKILIPWFVFGFIIAAAINSFIALPEYLLSTLKIISQFSLAIAMAALGIQTKWAVIKCAGLKPILLSFILLVILLPGGYVLNSLLITL